MDDLDGEHFFGTAQPASARDVSAKNRNAVLPVHLQEARDEKGRKRLHGAFTGGFSAGYYNTVGSKEGWQPKTFQTSRSSRAKFEQNPDDFMDEEDRAEINASQKISTTDDFDILGGTERELARKNALSNAVENSDGAIAARMIQELVIPSSDPVGMRLLRKMGWRDGQGVGPRVKRKKEQHVDNEDIHAESFLFAPRDITALVLTGRVGPFGLGYDQFNNAEVFRSRTSTKEFTNDGGGLERGSRMIGMRGGFGTGVFDDDDDDDPYSNTTRSSMNFSLEDDDEGDDNAISHYKYHNPKASELIGRKKPPSGSTVTASVRLGFDGKPPLNRFHIASFQITSKIWFDAPQPPPGFVSKHRQLAETAASNQGGLPQNANKSLTAEQRRDMLGEEALNGPSRSVFSFISRKEQDRLQSLLERTSGKGKEEKKEEKPVASAVPVDKDTALAALKGFLPFQTDEAKQERYKRYLEHKAGILSVEVKHPPHFTDREVAHELLEFSKSAHMYKPLSSMMASRFTSSGTGLQEKNSSPTVRVYGTETRVKSKFRPHKLLCKRFNIANPYPDSKSAGTPATGLTSEDMKKEVLNKDTMEGLQTMIDQAVAKGEKGSQSKAERIITDVPDVGGRDVPVRPAMDIFKAIFADSDSASNSDSDDDVIVSPKKMLPETSSIANAETFRPVFKRRQDRTRPLTIQPGEVCKLQDDVVSGHQSPQLRAASWASSAVSLKQDHATRSEPSTEYSLQVPSVTKAEETGSAKEAKKTVKPQRPIASDFF